MAISRLIDFSIFFRPQECIKGGSYYGGGGAGIIVEGHGSFGSGGYIGTDPETGVVLLEI